MSELEGPVSPDPAAHATIIGWVGHPVVFAPAPPPTGNADDDGSPHPPRRSVWCDATTIQRDVGPRDPRDRHPMTLKGTSEETGVVRGTRSMSRLEVSEITRRPSPIRRLANVWQYRELLGNLIRKELKVKYKNSILGFFWSLLNPAFLLIVYSFVFTFLFKTGIPLYAIFMICGLLPWTFFTNALSGGVTAIVANSELVNKVWFPREILPIAAVGAAMVHWMLQSIVLVVALGIVRKAPAMEFLPLLIPAIIALVLLATACAILLSAVNVYLRDTQHLLEIVTMAWFWATPIVWAYPMLGNELAYHGVWRYLGFINPVTPIVTTFQRALYHERTFNSQVMPDGTVMNGVVPGGSPGLYLAMLLVVIVGALIALAVALVVFGRLEDNFGEEI